MGLFYKALFTCIVFIGVITGTTYSQQKDIDSLTHILSKKSINDTNKVNLLNQIAFDYYGVNISQLKAYASQALQLSLKLKFSNGEAFAYKNIGLGYMGSNANPLALIYFDKSLAIFKKLGDSVNSAKILNNMGYYYGRIKDNEQELNYLLQAFGQIKRSNKIAIKATILGNIGNSYEAANKPDSALAYYQRAMADFVSTKQNNIPISAYCNLVSAHLKLNKLNQATYYANKMMNILAGPVNYRPKDLAMVYLTLGQLSFQLKNYDKSRGYFNRSLNIGNQIGNPETITGVYHGYYLIDSVKGNYLSALKNYHQYVRLNDSLMNVTKSRVLSLYEVKSDLQKRADENERLKIEQEKNQAIIIHQNTTEIILIVGLVIIAIGLIYLISINKQVKHQSTIINRQNKILESNNLVKDKLFSVISHDLRSPITQVIGLLNLWEQGEMKHHEMTELTPIVKNRIIQTLDLLDNLLIWSNNQLQGFKFKALPFELDKVINNIIQHLKPIITQKALNVENMVEPGTIVRADSEMIKIVLRNLISNAIKFTPANGSIKVKSKFENGFVVIAVEDTGIGIKEKDMAKIFSFTSHTTLGTDDEKGTGMGLKICKDFIDLNNGNIRMESKENEGSTFYVSIPQNIMGL
ncbi:tetratricopeptide repeat-containing sensor histidine kinase [Mucilaginibacter sp. HMF5004]|uniref:tetratricopeptide repeat-containing sensor histidine kinase n=1 Tax=Mucilaginibacter rivuli TaxID=2857527 RepID=UPI001C5F0D2D|nr:ATP-binding protein [Mucilaginibacter rivuli]MBW4891736.1 tetratricopeptide repeat-containing sensor histidine kinase [Mucilaginibacter rivuli]